MVSEPLPGGTVIGMSTSSTCQDRAHPGATGRKDTGGSAGAGVPPREATGLGVADPCAVTIHPAPPTRPGDALADEPGVAVAGPKPSAPHPPRANGSSASASRLLVSDIHPP